MPTKDNPVNFDVISQIHQAEQKSTILTKVPKEFYKELREFLNRLKEALEESQAEASSKTMMLSDEYRRARRRATQIWETRERKITLLALSAVNEIHPDTKLMVGEEKELFEMLVSVLKENREQNLIGKNNEESITKQESVSKSLNIETDQKEESYSHFEKKRACDEDMVKNETPEIPIVLILEDIPSFETGEGVLNLKKDDVISLPKQVAQILCQHEKARIIGAS